MGRFIIFLSVFALCFLPSNAQLTGTTLTGARVNTTNLSTTITSNNSFVVASSPNGNVYQIELRKAGSPTIVLADGFNQFNIYSAAVVQNPSTLVFSPFSIPYNAAPGVYSLYVGYLDPLLQNQFYPASSFDSLQNVFTILPPDGYLQGTVFEDLNENGVQDAGEPGINNGILNVTPGGQFPISSNGTFSIPASNGAVTITWSRSSSNNMYLTNNTPSYAVTVNNANVTQLNFPLKRKLKFVSPNQLIAGQTIRVTIVGDTMVSQLSMARFFRNSGGGSTVYTSSGNISVIDSSTISIRLSVPSVTGPYNVYVYNTGSSSNPNFGYHYLYNALTVIPSTATISGKVYYDSNNNGLYDSGEPPLAGQQVHLMPDDAYAITDNNGNYSIGATFGNHTISMGTPNGQLALGSGPASYTFTSSGPVSGKDFGLLSTNPAYSSTTRLIPTRPRCNTNNIYTLRVTNTGNIPYNGRVYLLRDPLTVWNGSSPVASGSTATGDTIWWNLQNLQPFIPASINLALLMPGPGTTIYNRAYFDAYDPGNVTQLTSTQNIAEQVLCSYDPNDKSCTPEGIGTEHYTLINQELEYLIRFQNTGNDTAYDVNIYDRIDTSLDWASLQIVETSHSCVTTLDSVGQARFSFKNIYLPDSNVNEPASNGFVRYRVRPKSTTPDFTVVNNTAYIVFDLNPAIVTNTTFNTLVTQIPLWINENRPLTSARVVPNPVTGIARFILEGKPEEWSYFEATSLEGKPVFRSEASGENVVFDTSGLPAGIYFYRYLSKEGKIVSSGRFIVQ